ncbi:dioxygenase family protein [Burkholderia cepacia]|uniref:dioxygenase family protein n=1 Tax=Burkholderia cepacia TaxID=292 RepID=UPI003EE2357A
MSTANNFRRQPVFFLSHDGNLSLDMGSQASGHDQHLERSIRHIPRQLSQRPDAILFVSGDWQEPAFTISSPPESATSRNRAAVPEHRDESGHLGYGTLLSKRVHDLLDGAALPTREAPDYQIDDGMLNVLGTMYPDASIPVARLSLRASLDPGIHWAAGHAIAQLRDENVLIIGSGSRHYEQNRTRQAAALSSVDFEMWLRRALLEEEPSHRIMALLNWERAPAARIAHPSGNSLMPLLLIAGTAGDDPATCVTGSQYRRPASPSSYRFGHIVGESDARRMRTRQR